MIQVVRRSTFIFSCKYPYLFPVLTEILEPVCIFVMLPLVKLREKNRSELLHASKWS